MNAASMVVPTMPDAGYSQWIAGGGSQKGIGFGDAPHGNLTQRGDTHNQSPQSFGGLDMTNKVLTANKLVSNSYLVNETEEDSIIPILPLIREAMVRSHARAIEHSLLMGGATDDLIATPYSGLVKLATDDSKIIVAGDTSPVSQDLSAPADDLLRARKAMGKYGRRPADVMFIVSLDYYFQLLEDPDFQTINEVGDQRATRVTGEIGNIYGSPVVVCDEFPAAATGKPAAVAVNTRNFVVPVLRGVTIEQDYEVANQRRVLVASQRRGFDQMFADAGQVVVVNYD